MNKFFIENRFRKYKFSNDFEKLMFLLGVLNNEVINRCKIYKPKYSFQSRNAIKKVYSKTVELVKKLELQNVNKEALQIISMLILKIDEVSFDEFTAEKFFILGLSQ